MSDGKTIQFDHYEQWVLLAHGADAPTPGEWEQYVAYLKNASEDENTHSLLVLSPEGVGPDSVQRKMIAGIDLRTAVLTPSRLARGIATALSWFGVNIKAFTPVQYEEACDYLDVKSDQDQLELLQRLASMRLELAGQDPAQTEGMSKRELEDLIAQSMSELQSREP